MLPLDCRRKWPVPFHPRRAFNIEALGIATIVLSAATLVVLLFAIAD
jgi:hypothetical protein